MPKRIIILALIVFAAAAAWRPESGFRQAPGPADRSSGPDAASGGITDSANPVSLPALMAKSFNGQELKLGQKLLENESYVRYYITYRSGELSISGIMNVPKGSPPQGGFPVLVLNHGYIDPGVYTNGRGLKREQDFLARQGFAVLHTDYRNHANSDKDPDADTNVRLGYVEDAINAVYAIKNSDYAFLSKDRIGMLGHSMGGGVALGVLVAKPELVKAAVLFAPVSGNLADSYERWLKRRPETAEKIKLAFGEPGDNPGFWKNISPETFYSRVAAPVQIHHGTADPDVPLAWSERLEEKLKAENKQAALFRYAGQPHEFTSAWPEAMQKTAKFFRETL